MGDISNIDEAMAEIRLAMLLLRRNSNPDSALFWEALLEVNRALAKEDIEKAIRYLNALLKVFILSYRTEFPDVYEHARNGYEQLLDESDNAEDVHSMMKSIQRYGAISRVDVF